MFQDRGQLVNDFRSDYATIADFCHAFADGTRSLCLLAFLLTTNHSDAEDCFVAAVERAFRSNNVFKEWVASWIRRSVIACAITTVFDTRNREARQSDRWCIAQGEGGSAIDAITRLADRERFVFVMSVSRTLLGP